MSVQNFQMTSVFSSTLLLTLLLAIGLVFFLRAASKDRTTVVDVYSPLPPLEVLNGISFWLEERGWKRDGGDADRQVLRFNGSVTSSAFLAALLALIGAFGAGSLGLVLRQLFPSLGWWPLFLAFIGGPAAGMIYQRKSSRIEDLELRLMSVDNNEGSKIRLRAHRDELIAMEKELAKSLQLASDGSLLSSPI